MSGNVVPAELTEPCYPQTHNNQAADLEDSGRTRCELRRHHHFYQRSSDERLSGYFNSYVSTRVLKTELTNGAAPYACLTSLQQIPNHRYYQISQRSDDTSTMHRQPLPQACLMSEGRASQGRCRPATAATIPLA